MAPPSESLFLEPGGTPADVKRLIELLSARLADDCVHVPLWRQVSASKSATAGCRQ